MAKLVAFFSASGVTAKLAKNLADSIGADLFEIEPREHYTQKDLDWTDSSSRSTVEMKDPSSRPAIVKSTDVSGYDTVFVGFPIWWYTAPTVVKTFLESADFAGKKIVPFATSGGSPMGNACSDLQKVVPKADVKEGKVFKPSASKEELAAWAKGF